MIRMHTIPRRSRGLVIDDENRVRDVVCEMLHFVGWEATAAATGSEGLARLEEDPYDLVLTDLAMPGLSGWDVVTAVRRHSPAIGVIAMAATATPRETERASRLGLRLLPKPFGIEALAAALGDHASRDPVRFGSAGAADGPALSWSARGARSLRSYQGGPTDMAQLRIPLDSHRFATGLSWKDYLAQMGDTRARTEENYAKAVLTDEERRFFASLGQVRYALLLAENWCGDVHRNAPLLARIAEAMPSCELRVFFRDQNLDLTDCFLNNGYRSIPIIVFFDEGWSEIGRWVERAAAATQRAFGVRARTVDVAPPEQQEAAMTEFRKQVQAAYEAPNSLWRDAAKEIRQVLETRLGLASQR